MLQITAPNNTSVIIRRCGYNSCKKRLGMLVFMLPCTKLSLGSNKIKTPVHSFKNASHDTRWISPSAGSMYVTCLSLTPYTTTKWCNTSFTMTWAMAGSGIIFNASGSALTPLASKPSLLAASIMPSTFVPFLSVKAYCRMRAIGNANP